MCQLQLIPAAPAAAAAAASAAMHEHLSVACNVDGPLSEEAWRNGSSSWRLWLMIGRTFVERYRQF